MPDGKDSPIERSEEEIGRAEEVDAMLGFLELAVVPGDKWVLVDIDSPLEPSTEEITDIGGVLEVAGGLEVLGLGVVAGESAVELEGSEVSCDGIVGSKKEESVESPSWRRIPKRPSSKPDVRNSG